MTAALPSLAKRKPRPAWASLLLFDRKEWKRMAFAESLGGRAGPKNAQEESYVDCSIWTRSACASGAG